jgi:alpha-D-ribose 1-methylphosphonate 5-triphosphate synthase subunit PhnL
MKKIIVKNLHKEFTVHTRGGLKIDGYHDITLNLKEANFYLCMVLVV